MPTIAPCCCSIETPENFCHGCYPNLKVSPITVKIEKKPRYPPYKRPNIKPINFDSLFPPGPSSSGQSAVGVASTPCERCAKILRAKEIQLIRKDQELLQLQRHLRNHGGKKHDYGSVRELEFQLRKREHEIAKLNMEQARLETTRIYNNPSERITCSTCSKRLRQKESQIRKIEQEVVRQMASPYIKISPNPCSCCSDAARPQTDEKKRKKNRNNCFKELNKKEKKLKKKEKEIDKKIKKFREENLKEAKEDLKKTPDSFIKDVYLNCKCACTRTNVKKKLFDPCSYNANAKSGTWACTMPFPMWNGSVAPQMHTCTTKCCVMKLLEGLATCYFCPLTCGKKKTKTEDTCIPMRLLKWWVFRNRKPKPKKHWCF